MVKCGNSKGEMCSFPRPSVLTSRFEEPNLTVQRGVAILKPLLTVGFQLQLI